MSVAQEQITVSDKVVDTVLSTLPILEVLDETPRLVMTDWSERGVNQFKDLYVKTLEVIGRPLDLEFLDYTPDNITSFELSARNFIKSELGGLIESGDLREVSLEDLHRSWKLHFLSSLNQTTVRSEDGLTLNVYFFGDERNDMIVIVPPCGMPKELYFNWIRFLCAEYFVVTWDARGLFNEKELKSDFGISLEDQVNDLFRIIDHFGVNDSHKVHLLGLCGGAVIGLKAASGTRKNRISSLSVWHGDLDFGELSLKTTHQKNTCSLMQMGSASISDADMMHKQLMQKPSVLKSLPTSVAHLVIYPYATVELFHHYCRLNRILMETNSEAFLHGVDVPVLVVTSSEDDTAHPDGSRHLSEQLVDVTFIEEPKGKHIEVFGAPQRLIAHQIEFLKKF